MRRKAVVMKAASVEYRAVDPDLYPRGGALVIAAVRASGEGRQRASNTGGKSPASGQWRVIYALWKTSVSPPVTGSWHVTLSGSLSVDYG